MASGALAAGLLSLGCVPAQEVAEVPPLTGTSTVQFAVQDGHLVG